MPEDDALQEMYNRTTNKMSWILYVIEGLTEQCIKLTEIQKGIPTDSEAGKKKVKKIYKDIENKTKVRFLMFKILKKITYIRNQNLVEEERDKQIDLKFNVATFVKQLSDANYTEFPNKIEEITVNGQTLETYDNLIQELEEYIEEIKTSDCNLLFENLSEKAIIGFSLFANKKNVEELATASTYENNHSLNFSCISPDLI